MQETARLLCFIQRRCCARCAVQEFDVIPIDTQAFGKAAICRFVQSVAKIHIAELELEKLIRRVSRDTFFEQRSGSIPVFRLHRRVRFLQQLISVRCA